jgi:hypothetical protein
MLAGRTHRAAYHYWRTQAQQRSAGHEQSIDLHIGRGQDQSVDNDLDL